ncbi:FtsQ-type POTRA domain-containing protein [Pseudodesulfovibrio sp.]|uniref:cell division protein FtsQ/DivIB n=1 Tax=Pseudodesulfovibrio sp. TaxID=2035812 RepID=UPI002620FAF7|nr:FtsQ-type POTRA domain-containing protein [Pseudodesulfovibrio sp.]MDD3312618.1 FtsQ-type POTRA domain-containing protein [Pseudodesulfovibrio sp.]
MSTLTLGKQGRLGLNTLNGKANTRRKTRRSAPRLTGPGRLVMRSVLLLLTASFVAVLGVGLLFGYRYLTTSTYFELQDISVTGNERLNYGDILKCADVALGLNCLEMNVGEVEARLSDNPWIAAVTVRRELPNRLHIAIKEKVPAFWVRQGDGLYFADATGKVIAPMHPGETASLPVLEVADSGEDGGAVLTGFLKSMADHETPFTPEQTAWIRLTSAHELEVYLDGHDEGKGLTVRLSMDRWRLQLERVKIAWRDLMRRGEFKDAAIIAASGDKVWVKRRADG